VRRVSRCFAFGFAFAFAFALCGVAPAGFLLPGAVAPECGPERGTSFKPRLRNKVRAGVRTQVRTTKWLIPRRGQRGGDPQQCAHRLWTGGGL